MLSCINLYIMGQGHSVASNSEHMLKLARTLPEYWTERERVAAGKLRYEYLRNPELCKKILALRKYLLRVYRPQIQTSQGEARHRALPPLSQ